MFRFRFGPFPVEVHFGHLLINAFVAYSFVSYPTSTAWPAVVLNDPANPRRALTFGLVLAGWMALISLSVFAHELGHAITARLFGSRPSIHFVGLGGLTVYPDGGSFEWWKQALITLSGPAAGLLFGVLAGLLALVGGSSLPDGVRYFAVGIFQANLFWTVLNLLPISTFDGGRLAELFLTRFLGRTGFLIAQLVALAFAAGLLLLAFLSHQLLIGVVVLMMTGRTLANISAYQRGELPLGAAAHPLTTVVERAEALYRERKLDEAYVLARGLAEAQQTPPALRSRAHVLLGWISIKQSNGRRALDHFSQVQGLVVPVHALAAAFSLIGDETRAIPLWAQAVQQNNDETIVHEYAGALIRAGRDADARALQGVNMARAYLAAERVHYVRKEFVQGAAAAESAFREEPTAEHAYTAACAWALAGKTEDALRMLQLASQNGFHDTEAAQTDADLKSLRARPEFQAWLGSLSTAR